VTEQVGAPVGKLKITQVKSRIGSRQNQRDTLRTLGLRKIGQSTVRDDRPAVRGMIRTVAHLVKVEKVD
jgi:large subunit ribosomal protein L30